MNFIYYDIFEAFTSNCKTYLNQHCVSLFRRAFSNSLIIPLGYKTLRLISRELFLKPLQRCIIPGLLSGSLRHRISYVRLTNLTPPLANFLVLALTMFTKIADCSQLIVEFNFFHDFFLIKTGYPL